MKAMILAAGLGTRLKPITDSIPKALVKIDGVPMLERIILKLKSQGFDYIVVNVHHFASQIKEFLSLHNYGIDIVLSDESSELLDTGGGIVNAAPLLFKKDYGPVLIHNVDIISNACLHTIRSGDREGAELLVNDRESSRKLLFNKSMILKGWHDLKKDVYRPEDLKVTGQHRELAFSGIYSISYAGVEEMKNLLGKGKYSVMDYFLHPERKLPIRGYSDNQLKITDIGKPETLANATLIL